MIAMKKYGLLAVGILLLGAALVVGATALPGVGPDRGNSNTGTNGYGYGSGGMMGAGPGAAAA